MRTWGRPTKVAILAAALLIELAAALIAIEALMALALYADLHGPELWKRARREYYVRYERHIVQYLPECAEFEPQLGYRLKPGRCRFHNREFDHEIFVNSTGMRDREEALVRPAIVVTGDSIAMGWGVAQSETLSAVLAELTGAKTLDAAISSYGTAREMILLRRVDLSAAHTLVLQYCENDYVENSAFLRNGARLPTMDEDTYRGLVRAHHADTRYWPGKHLRHLLPLLGWAARGHQSGPEPRDCAVDARVFLDVLDRAGLQGPLRVVAFEATYTVDQGACFGRELKELAARRALPGWISELQVIEPASFLTASDYYPLDGHLNAAGHRKIAAAIAAVISAPAR